MAKLLLVSAWLISLLLSGGVTPASAETLEEYRDKGITVTHVLGSHPYSFIGHDGEAQGVVPDFWREWSKATGIPVKLKLARWKETFDSVLDGKADVHGGFMRIAEREGAFDFSPPLFSIMTVLITKDNGKSTDTIFEKGLIGAVANGAPGLYVNENHPEADVMYFDTPSQVVKAFAAGDVDAISMDLPTFAHNNQQMHTPITGYVTKELFLKTLHAGVAKGNDDLLKVINQGLAGIDTYKRERLMSRWFVPTSPKPHASSYAIWFIPVTLLVFLSGLLGLRHLEGRKRP